MNEVEVRVSYGVLAKPIEEQLNEYGLTLGDEKDFIHKLHKSLIRCRFHLLTEHQYRSALRKLHKEVINHLKRIDDRGE